MKKIRILIVLVIIIIAVFIIFYLVSKRNKSTVYINDNEIVNNTKTYEAELYIDSSKILLSSNNSSGLKYIFEISDNQIISSGTQTDYKTEELAISMVDQLKQIHADNISDYKIFNDGITVTYIRIFNEDEVMQIDKFICDNLESLISDGQKLYIYQGIETRIFSSMPILLKEVSDDKKVYTSESFNNEYLDQSIEEAKSLNNYYLIYKKSKHKMSVSQAEKEYEGKKYQTIIIDSEKIEL